MIEVNRTNPDKFMTRPPTYRPYIAWGRRQLRIGWVRRRHDRWCDEYHFIGFEWHL